MAVLYTNNAASTLAAAITSNSQTSISLAAGTGALFPNPSSPDYFYLTLDDAVNIEIVKCTARSTDTLTVVRGQEGTVAQSSFSTGTKADLRLTAAGLGFKVEKTANLTSTRVPFSDANGLLTDYSGFNYVSGTTSGGLAVPNTTASTSKTTGSVVTGGGLGVGGAIYAGRYVHVAQTYTPSGGATATLDCSLSNVHEITMPAGNITIALSNIVDNQCIMVSITQDGTGSRTVTWFTTIRWAGGSAPTLTTTGNKRDVFGFKRTGTNTYDGFIIGQNL